MSRKIIKFELSKAQEEYLQMYHAYFALNWNQYEICEYYNCSPSKVTKSIKWVIDNKIKIPSKHLIKGAIDATSIRLRRNKELYDREVSKTRYRDNSFIIALTREIREDERTLYKMLEVYKGDEDDDSKMSSAQVLGLIRQAQNGKSD